MQVSVNMMSENGMKDIKRGADLSGRRVLVFGAGRSGVGACELLLSRGAKPVLYDGNASLTEDQVRAQFASDGPDAVKWAEAVRIVTGPLTQELIDSSDLCVISPGVPTDIEPVNRIREAGVMIWGEVELAYSLSKGEVLAVTGTNGKITTVTLLGELMKRFRGEQNVHVVGNIGAPYTKAANATRPESVCVAEISSFQLETIHSFHPHVSAITNITPDHLNRHHTMEEYIRVKERIAENQTREDVLILNYEDEVLRSFGESMSPDGPRVWWFSSRRKLEKGMFLENGILKAAIDGAEGVQDVIRTDELQILGAHNYENVSVAVLAALAVHMPMEQIREVLKAFPGVEHRIEYAGEAGGVAFYNDSKGTNPDAAIKAVEAMKRPTILIGGGYDKDSSYDTWIESFHGKVKALVLVGATREKIAACAKAHGFSPVYLCDTFEECFDTCVGLAQSGDAVLLSPACASWGMFRDYEERGRVFKELVLKWKERTGAL
jgi:UDP-N-acetylmuramoylalanine--D-glutamate ligase